MHRSLVKILAVVLAGALVTASMPATSADEAQANKTLIQKLVETVFNRHDLSIVETAMAPDYIQHNPWVPPGREGFRGYMAATFAAIPDWRFTTERVIAEGDLVLTYGTYSGTQQGEWGRIPATGKTFKMQAADIWRVKDGRVVEHWDVLDTASLLRQLGGTVAPPRKPD